MLVGASDTDITIRTFRIRRLAETNAMVFYLVDVSVVLFMSNNSVKKIVTDNFSQCMCL